MKILAIKFHVDNNCFVLTAKNQGVFFGGGMNQSDDDNNAFDGWKVRDLNNDDDVDTISS